MRISDWSSDVCSSDLVALEDEVHVGLRRVAVPHHAAVHALVQQRHVGHQAQRRQHEDADDRHRRSDLQDALSGCCRHAAQSARRWRSEEHTSELQSLMRNSYSVFCLTITKYKNYRLL